MRIIAPGGVLLDAFPVDRVCGNPYRWSEKGTYARYWRKAWIPTPGATEQNLPSQMVILDRAGRRVDSVHVPAPGESGGRGFALNTNDGVYFAVPSDSLYAVGPDGAIVTASPSRYHLKVVRGDRTLEVTRDDAAVPYGDEERAEWLAWHRYLSGRNPQQRLAPDHCSAFR